MGLCPVMPSQIVVLSHIFIRLCQDNLPFISLRLSFLPDQVVVKHLFTIDIEIKILLLSVECFKQVVKSCACASDKLHYIKICLQKINKFTVAAWYRQSIESKLDFRLPPSIL